MQNPSSKEDQHHETDCRDRNFVVTMITPVAIKTIGFKYYIVYTCIGAFVPITVYFLYPEVSIPSSIITGAFY
jgi:VIT1/CCC1 family predicted Fe2+/Mn2+ transporter